MALTVPGPARPVVAAAALAALALYDVLGPGPVRADRGPAWPSGAHPLGIDASGRDFLAVVAEGARDFVVPGALSATALTAVLAAMAAAAVQRVAPGAPETPAGPSRSLVLAGFPRLLAVMAATLALPEPSPAVVAAVVTVLYLPVAVNEARARLDALAAEDVLVGLVAHGLSPLRITLRHVLHGYLREPIARHGAQLFVQVALTQIAMAFVFGASAVSAAGRASWGVELKRLAPSLPGPAGFGCLPGDPCPARLATFHAMVLAAAAWVLLGSLQRRAARPAG